MKGLTRNTSDIMEIKGAVSSIVYRRPQILPETHFSLHSAIRSVKYKNDEESVWFIKAPGCSEDKVS